MELTREKHEKMKAVEKIKRKMQLVQQQPSKAPSQIAQ